MGSFSFLCTSTTCIVDMINTVNLVVGTPDLEQRPADTTFSYLQNMSKLMI